MQIPDILTDRLRLVAITPSLMDAEAIGNDAFSAALHADVPSQWPPKDWEPHVFDFIRRLCVESPHAIAWNRYVVLREEPATLIGTLCAFPKEAGIAEAGYSILEPWRCRGLASEGMRAQIAQVFENASVNSVIAQTFPALPASIRVMEKCGLTPDGAGSDEGTVQYRLTRAAYESSSTK